MKKHYCPEEKCNVEYEGECNWCGEREDATTSMSLLDLAIKMADHIDSLGGNSEKHRAIIESKMNENNDGN